MISTLIPLVDLTSKPNMKGITWKTMGLIHY